MRSGRIQVMASDDRREVRDAVSVAVASPDVTGGGVRDTSQWRLAGGDVRCSTLYCTPPLYHFELHRGCLHPLHSSATALLLSRNSDEAVEVEIRRQASHW